MGDKKIRNVNNKNKRVGITSVLLALERLSKLFPTKPETGDNSWFGQPLLFNSNVKAIRPVGNNLETRIITNEYLALPPELNLNLNEIYRGGILLSEAELEALVNRVLIVPSSQPHVSELCVIITVSQAILSYFRLLLVHSEKYCNLPSTFTLKHLEMYS